MCELEKNPALPSTEASLEDVSGKVLLAQSPYGGQLWMKASIAGLEGRQDYAISINESGWDEADCASSGSPWKQEEVQQIS